MNKLNGQSKDILEENVSKIKELFPEAFEEGKINFDSLKKLLGNFIDADNEKYSFAWNGKNKAIKTALTPTSATLRPDRESSKSWDSTENIFIEGDNLEVLKVLQDTYRNKVKMIYIDPPYNTGHDFVYSDNFNDTVADYKERTNQAMVSNADTNGRYHTNWLNMMYPRLRLARNLLTDDGVIFISIDDNEIANLRKLCDEILGEENFIGILVWEKKKKGAFLSGNLTNIKEYIIIYSKNNKSFAGLIGETARQEETYPVIKTTNTRGTRKIKKGILSKFSEENHLVSKGSRISAGNMEMILLDDMVIENNELKFDVRVDSNWIYSQKLLDEYADSKELYITQDLYFRRIVTDPREKKLKDILFRVGENDISGADFVLNENLFSDGWGTNEDGNNELHQLMGVQNLFDFPKPSKLLSKLFFSLNDKETTVLDFFSGSGTTAHSIINLNAQDGGSRKWICVQIPERADEKSEAYKAGYKYISDISKERIRRAGEKIKSDNKDKEGIDKLDVGFKAFTLDSTNLTLWDEKTQDLQTSLLEQINSTKNGRTQEDVLYEVLLKYGVDLATPITEESINSKKIYSIAGGYLLVCLDKDIDLKTVTEIAKKKPERVVFYDHGFKDDMVKINAEQTLKKAGIEDIRVI